MVTTDTARQLPETQAAICEPGREVEILKRVTITVAVETDTVRKPNMGDRLDHLPLNFANRHRQQPEDHRGE